MANNVVSLRPDQQSKTFYASALRCIGQSLESMELKAVDVKTHGDNYVIQAWNKGTSTSMDIERHCSLEDLKQLEMDGREKRKTLPGLPNLLSLSHVLRLAGNYVDRMRGRLIRVSWQDQSDKIQSVTIQYEPHQPERREHTELQTTVIEEICLHIYKQRKKIATAHDKDSSRSFVSVSQGS
jgi:hypothetical protein